LGAEGEERAGALQRIRRLGGGAGDGPGGELAVQQPPGERVARIFGGVGGGGDRLQRARFEELAVLGRGRRGQGSLAGGPAAPEQFALGLGQGVRFFRERTRDGRMIGRRRRRLDGRATV